MYIYMHTHNAYGAYPFIVCVCVCVRVCVCVCMYVCMCMYVCLTVISLSHELHMCVRQSRY